MADQVFLGIDYICPICDKPFVDFYFSWAIYIIKSGKTKVRFCSIPCKREYERAKEVKHCKKHITYKEKIQAEDYIEELAGKMSIRALACIMGIKEMKLQHWHDGTTRPNREDFNALESIYNNI